MNFLKSITKIFTLTLLLYICIGFFQTAYAIYPFAGRKRFLLKGIFSMSFAIFAFFIFALPAFGVYPFAGRKKFILKGFFSMSFAIFAFFIFALPALGATRTWDGSDSTVWTLDANWAEGTAPTSTDDVVINGSYTNAPTLDLSGGTTINSLSIGSSATSVLTVSNGNDSSNKLTVTGDITIGGSGTITHTANTSAQTHRLNIEANNITISSGGTIDVIGKGYGASYGPGGRSGMTARSGAGYGGIGGTHLSYPPGGSAYGSLTQPTDLGSSACAVGGGAIKLVVNGTANISGSITANGNDGGYRCGGGSGGSVWIIANTLSGNGSITTNGGANNYTGYDYGGGGGGRISIQYTTDNYSGTKTAYGGIGGSPYGGAGTIYTKSSTETYGKLFINNNAKTTGITPLLNTGGNGGGDALWQFDNDISGVTNGGYLQILTGVTLTISGSSVNTGTNGIVYIDGGTFSAPNATTFSSNIGTFTLNSGTFSAPSLSTNLNTAGTVTINGGTFTSPNTTSLTVGTGGILNLNSTAFTTSSLATITINGTLSFGNGTSLSSNPDITINNGGVLTHSANTTSKTNYLDLTLNSLTINSGGSINVDGKGYSANNGSGKGGADGSSGSGGGYGGIGGVYSTYSPGAAYGSLTQPIDLGSGGGYSGSGGGAVKLTISGTISVNGSISAKGGESGNPSRGGGGAGGSIWIISDTITGNGSITTNAATYNSYGAGGRIAIQYTTDNYTGTKTSYGATATAGAGTIYTKSSTETYGKLFVNNNSQTSGITPLLTTGGNGGGASLWQFDNDLSGITNGGYLRIDTGVNLILSGSSINTGTNTIVYINGGNLSASNATVLNPAASILTLNSGTVSVPNLSNNLTITGTFNINGGMFASKDITSLTVAASSTLNLTGGTFRTSQIRSITLNGTLSLYGSGGNIIPKEVDMTINNGGTLTHAANTTAKSNYLDLNLNSLTINSGGTINLNGKGYSSQNGSGAGATGSYGGGAGYGGKGGAGNGAAGGVTYGSLTEPIDLGSGGGIYTTSCPGGSGGGAIKIRANGINISGSITANGNVGGCSAGGGSGGSVWIIAKTLSGSGSVTANGGKSGSGSAGNGAGGRIAIYADNNNSSLSITANGETGGAYRNGQEGTIYFNGEFISTIDPGNGSGTDYTSLSAWANAIKSDLTTKRTRAMDHGGITGTIADGVTLTGATSGYKATNVHAKSDQILVRDIRRVLDGTLTLTNGNATVTGSSTYFTSQIAVGDKIWLDADQLWVEVSSIESATSLTLTSTYSGTGGTGAGAVEKSSFTKGEQVYQTQNVNYVITSETGYSPIIVAKCKTTNGSADTTATTINGFTTSATNYVKIWTDPTETYRHEGKWDDSKYRLETTNTALTINDEYITVEGLQIELTASSTDSTSAISINPGNTTNDIKIAQNIIKGIISGTSNYNKGISINTTESNTKIENNIIYDFINGTNDETGISIDITGNHYVSNNTIDNCYTAYKQTAGTVIARNNIAQDTNDGFSGTFDATSDYNISDVATDAPGSNSKNLAVVNFISKANDDFRLLNTDTVAKNAGESLTTDPNAPVTEDIKDQTRTTTPDVGAHEGTNVLRLKGGVRLKGDMRLN